MSSNWRIPRRTFLRGMGTVVALPALEAMRPLTSFAAEPAAAASAAATPPKRVAFLFVPNGAHMDLWRPKQFGTDYKLSPTLEPLAEFKQDFSVLHGLTHDKGRANGDGPGDHARAVATFLTGAQPHKTAGKDIRVGVSVDQVAAGQIGHQTELPSLEIGCESGRLSGSCDSGYSCAYSSNISWRTESSPMTKEVDPRSVFDRLFARGTTADIGEAQHLRDEHRQSVIDFVMQDAKQLKKRLGANDRRKVDEYLDSIRHVERRIEHNVDDNKQVRPDMRRPDGIPQAYADHIRLMSDLMVLAFQTDTTRICTFMFANAGSNRSYRFIDVPEGHHSLSHHGGNEEKLAKIAKINRFHTEQFAYLLKRLKATPDGDSNLLDNSMIVYGSGLADGNRHDHHNLPVLLAGRGGGAIKPGRHIEYQDETPLMNLYVSLLREMDCDVDSLGDSTGALGQLS